MTRELKTYDSGCPVAYALDIFGDRWSLLIIRDMALKGARTYGELLNGWEGVSTNILAQRLKHLISAGMLTKQRDPENGRSYVYSLTQKARDLAPVLIEIILWSGQHNSADHAMTETLDKLHANRDGIEHKLRIGKAV